MFEKPKQYIYDKITGSQIVYDIICDAMEDAGIPPDNLDPTFERGCAKTPDSTTIPKSRRRRRRRRRR